MENASFAVGAVCEVEDKLAGQWVKAGWCEASKDELSVVVSQVEMSPQDLARAADELKAAGLRGRRATAQAEAKEKAAKKNHRASGK